MSEAEPGAGAGRRRVALWILRILGTAAGIAYVAWKVDLGDVESAISRVAPLAVAAACAITAVNLVLGALRWRVLLAAYGAPRPPRIARLVHAYFVGFFYNTYLPGGVGGDVVRGVVTRSAFGEEGSTSATASVAVVLVERVLGLSGLLLVVSGTSLVEPLPGTEGVLPFSAALLVAALSGVALLAMGRRLAPRLPARLEAIAAALPKIERPLPFGAALGMSLVTQALIALTGWVLLASITAGEVTLGDALVLVPLAMAAVYFPFSVGGSGVREAAFVALGTRALGMSEGDALAASLLLWITQLAVGGVGGVLSLVAPLEARARDER